MKIKVTLMILDREPVFDALFDNTKITSTTIRTVCIELTDEQSKAVLDVVEDSNCFVSGDILIESEDE